MYRSQVNNLKVIIRALATVTLFLLTSCNPFGDSPSFPPTFLNPSSIPANLSFSEEGPYNFEEQILNSTTEKVFTVTNSGGASATSIVAAGLSSPFAFKGGLYPGIGGTCGAALSISESCTVVVTFNPLIFGSFSDTVRLNYNDGARSQTVTQNIEGAAHDGATLVVSDGPAFDFGTQFLAVSTDKTFTVTNSGNGIASAISAGGLASPFTFKGGSYPGTGGTCAAVLAPSASCTIVVNFQSATLGTFSETLSVSYSNGQNTYTATRTVSGTAQRVASLVISDGGTYDFGTKFLNTTTEKTFTVSNTGDVSATSIVASGLAAPFTFKGGTYPGTGGTCGASLAASPTTCTIVVTYLPTSAGSASATLQLAYHNGQSAQTTTRAMSGTGISVANLSISDANTYDFGTKFVGTSTDKVFTVTNSGGTSAASLAAVAFALASPFQFKGGTYPGTSGTCGTTLAASASCTVVLTYHPTASGSSSDTLGISYDNGQSSQTASRAVQGTGQTPASLSLSDGPSYDFGTNFINTATDKTFTLTNSGDVSATGISADLLTLPFSFKGAIFPGTGGNCGSSLAAGAHCDIVVRYNPTASSPTDSDTLQINYNDGQTSQSTSVALTATAVTAASLSVSDGATNTFGMQFVNTTTEKIFTVTNSGQTSATVMVEGTPALSAPFSFVGGSYPGGTGPGFCGSTLAAGQTCDVKIQFNPTSSGATFSNTVRISYNNGQAAQTATQTITGSAQLRATLSISDTPTYNYGSATITTSLDKTFTVTNSGDVSATSLGSSTLTAPFSFKGGSYPGTTGTCGTTLAAGLSCTMIVTFSPTAAVSSTDTLTLSYNDGVSSSTSVAVGLQGTGLTPAVLNFQDLGTYHFGNAAVNGYVDHVFTVQNDGQSTATGLAQGSPTLALPFKFKGGTYPGSGGSCVGSLASGATCNIIVRFSPTAQTTSSDTLKLSYHDGAASQNSSITMDGTGIALAFLLSMNESTYDFGTQSVNSSTDGTLSITNLGIVDATDMSGGTPPTAPFSFKGGSYPGTGGTCSLNGTLAPNASCTIVVTYNPTSIGSYSGNIAVNYTSNNGPTTYAVYGPVVGATPAVLSLSDGPVFTFPNQYVGYSVEKTFTLSNTGGSTATAVSSASLSAPFSFKGGSYPGTGGTCGTSLALGNNCALVVLFSPTSAVVSTGTLQVSYSDGITTQNTSVSLSGTGLTPAVLTVDDGSEYDFGSKLVDTSTEKTLTVTNTGALTATSMGAGAPALAAPFSFSGGSYPGGGTCGSTLVPSASCTVKVTFTPTSSGVSTDTVRISYFDGAGTVNGTRALKGTGLARATLSISDGPTYDYGTQFKNSSTEKTFTVTNSGETTATSIVASGLAAPFAFKGGSYPGTGGTCNVNGTLASHSATCTIVVVFNPITAPASFGETLTLTYNDGVATQTSTRALAGASQNPAQLSISDGATYNFGNVTINTTGEKSFVVSNTGDVAATSLGEGVNPLSAPFQFKGGSYPGAGGNCGNTLSPSGACTVVVTFSPTSASAYSDTIDLSYNDGQVTQSATRALSGTGVTPANLSISDGATYSYGTKITDTSTDKTFTVTNSGGSTASTMAEGAPALSSPFSFKGGSYPGTGGTCSTSLAGSGTTCTVVVTYNPTASGSFSDTLRIAYNDGASSQTASRGVSGSAVTPATLEISDVGYDYGNRLTGSSTDKTFTVTNSGQTAASSLGVGSPALSAPFSFKGGTYPGTGGTCGNSLAASPATCTVVVTFAPTSTGAFSDTVRLSYNDGVTTQTATRSITGTGVSPASLTISDGATYNFGAKAVNSSTDKTFTITNDGGWTATSMAEGSPALSAPITFKGGSYPGTGGTCAVNGSLAPSASCTVIVTYNPTAAGTYSKTLRISYNDGQTTQTATRAITGSTPAVLSISDGATYNYGTKAVNSSTDKTFTVTNSGASAASSMGGTPALTPPFSFKGGSYPGTGGTCGVTLAASSSCTVIVTYNPTASGSYSDTLSISYNDGETSQTATRAVAGTTPAILTISDATTYDYGNVANGYSSDKTFTVSNSGYVAATSMAAGSPALSAPFSFKGGSYPGTGGDCAGSLAVSASCTIVVTYAPTASGVSSNTVRVAYNDGVTTQTATRAVTGTAPVAGTLDTSFNSTGTVTSQIASVNLQVNGVAFQSDGKIIVAGSYTSASKTDFMVARFTTSGTLDTTFGSSGITRTAIGSGTNDDAAYAVVVDSSDRIYLAGRTLILGTTYNWALARYTSGGSLDTTFNSGGSIPGVVTTSTATLGGTALQTSEARALVIQPDGKIVVTGFAVFLNGATLENDFAVARFTTAGALDTTYNTTGTKLITNVGNVSATGSSGDIATGVLIDTANTNHIVLAGQGQKANINFGVSRDASDGSGTPTSATFSIAASSDDLGTCVAIDSNNQVVMGGYTGTNAHFGVARLQAGSTSKDTNFNSGAAGGYKGTFSFSVGNAATKDDRAYAIAVDPSNRIFLAGKAKNSGGFYDFAIARVTTAGALDTTFNTTGYKTITVTASVNNIANAMKIDSSGRIVMAGITTISGDIAIAITRVWP